MYKYKPDNLELVLNLLVINNNFYVEKYSHTNNLERNTKVIYQRKILKKRKFQKQNDKIKSKSL